MFGLNDLHIGHLRVEGMDALLARREARVIEGYSMGGYGYILSVKPENGVVPKNIDPATADKRQPGHVRIVVEQWLQLPIVGPEIMAPFADAMRLVMREPS